MTIKDEEQHCFHHSGTEGAAQVALSIITSHETTTDYVTLQVVTHVSSDFSNRIDVSLTLSMEGNVVRQSLVGALPTIQKRLGGDTGGADDSSSVWSISHRPSALQIQTAQRDLDTQEDQDTKFASVESIVLGNAEMRNRVQLEHTFDFQTLLRV